MSETAPASPPIPTGVADPVPFLLAQYGKELEAWLEVWKGRIADQATAEALAASRKDTADAVAPDATVVSKALDDARKDKKTEVENAGEDVDRAAEYALRAAIHTAYIDVTKSSLDRALTRLNVITASVTAITAIYTTMLGLVYSLDTSKGRALAFPAFIPVTFLGLTLLLVTIYAAVFRKKWEPGLLLPSGIGGTVNDDRLVHFMAWCFEGIMARRWALHAGILSLGLGLATLPIAFVSDSGKFQGSVFGVGLVVVAATGGITYLKDRPRGGVGAARPG
jgi:hypothetical protein